MAAKEMYDYLQTVAADNNQTLAVKPQRAARIIGKKHQVIHEGDDDSEERIDMGTSNITPFWIVMTWAVLNESDAGTLFEFWNASTHGDGIVKTFKWTGYVEPSASRHTYVIRFDCDLEQEIQIGAKYGHTNVKFKVVGRIAD